MERRVLRSISAPALLLALGLAAGCSSHAATVTTTQRSTTTTAPQRPTTTTSPSTTTTAPAGPSVSVSLEGLPASIRRGSGPIGFRIVLANSGDTAATSVAPLFQLVGPPCNCVAGTLERRDPRNGLWLPEPLPEGDGYDPLERAVGAVSIPAHASVTIDERITVLTANNPKAASALAYAVSLPDHRQLAVATVPVEITR